MDKIYIEKDETYGRYKFLDYDDFINSFGCQVLFKDDEGDYQGDTFVLYKDNHNNKYGYLCFGWGSCSGCDSLQSLNDYLNYGGYEHDEKQKLVDNFQDELHRDIKWFDSAQEALEWFKNKDWSLEYNYSKEFMENSINYLEKVTNEIQNQAG